MIKGGYYPPFVVTGLLYLYFGEKMEDFFTVGIVTTAHGIKGEVKVYPTTDDVKRFKKLKEVYVKTKNDCVKKHVESVKFFKQFVILKLEGIDTMNDAYLYKDATLMVDRENAIKCEKDEYFIADLFGLKVYDEERNLLGELTEVYQTGANDVYEITKEDGKTFLVPAIHDCIKSVDVKNKEMVIHLLQGLMD